MKWYDILWTWCTFIRGRGAIHLNKHQVMFNHVVRPLVSHCHRYYWFPLQLTSNKYQFKTIVHLYQPVLFFRFNSFAQTNTNSCLYAHSHTLFPLYSRDKIVARVARLIFYDHWYAGHSPYQFRSFGQFIHSMFEL